VLKREIERASLFHKLDLIYWLTKYGMVLELIPCGQYMFVSSFGVLFTWGIGILKDVRDLEGETNSSASRLT